MSALGACNQVGHKYADTVYRPPKINVKTPLPVFFREPPNRAGFTRSDTGVGEYKIHLPKGFEGGIEKRLKTRLVGDVTAFNSIGNALAGQILCH